MLAFSICLILLRLEGINLSSYFLFYLSRILQAKAQILVFSRFHVGPEHISCCPEGLLYILDIPGPLLVY